jgi:hypothetical protein
MVSPAIRKRKNPVIFAHVAKLDILMLAAIKTYTHGAGIAQVARHFTSGFASLLDPNKQDQNYRSYSLP